MITAAVQLPDPDSLPTARSRVASGSAELTSSAGVAGCGIGPDGPVAPLHAASTHARTAAELRNRIDAMGADLRTRMPASG